MGLFAAKLSLLTAREKIIERKKNIAQSWTKQDQRELEQAQRLEREMKKLSNPIVGGARRAGTDRKNQKNSRN